VNSLTEYIIPKKDPLSKQGQEASWGGNCEWDFYLKLRFSGLARFTAFSKMCESNLGLLSAKYIVNSVMNSDGKLCECQPISEANTS
jgi:hypothetical protein